MEKEQAEKISEAVLKPHRKRVTKLSEKQEKRKLKRNHQRKWAFAGGALGAVIGYFVLSNLLYGFLVGSGVGVIASVFVTRNRA